MARVFIYSDPHFFHKNVIAYESRPFDNVEIMNDALIQLYNETVGEYDVVYWLGDVAFAGKGETKSIIQRLNGRKILIMGNHDRARPRAWWLDVGFEQVIETPIIYKSKFILSHEPIEMWDCMPYLNIHGHTHTKTSSYKKHFNASCDMTGFKPIQLDIIRVWDMQENGLKE